MLVELTDRMFEEAARNPERFDWLLNRYRRMRTGAIWTFIGVVVIFFAFSVWFAWQLFCLFQVMGGHGDRHRPSALFEWMLSDKSHMGAFYIFCGWVVFSFMMGLTSAIIADLKVKNLILFRALRDGVAPKPRE
jgi:hypothetical protein